MGEDTDFTSAAPLRRLKHALESNTGIREALLDIGEHHDALWAALFTVTVRDRFVPGSDIRDVTAFTARITADDPTFPARQAETLIRGAMGEVLLLASLDATRVRYPQTWNTILRRIFEEWRPSQDEIAALVDHVQAALRQAQDARPSAEPAIEQWLLEAKNAPWSAMRSGPQSTDSPP